jgi:A/G-specific adenine glycosylase
MRFSYLIIEWYKKYRRDLPWRHTSDPYKIWVSEVILQQTRVEQGLAYYERFTGRFPDVGALAKAEEEEVIKTWQGLGYYSRARHMHQAARMIVNDNRSEFPATYNDLLKLKGIGDYSASAISSIAFGEPNPVIDGNVMRVMARFSGIEEPVNTLSGKKIIKEILSRFIDRENPGDFNQAMMELGALVCKPRQPNCQQCPVSQECFAFRHQKTGVLPVLKKIKALKTRYFHYLFIINTKNGQKYTWIKKRTEDDIWKNLYDFPLIEAERELSEGELMKSDQMKQMIHDSPNSILSEGLRFRHLLSHQELLVRFFILDVDNFYHKEYQKVKIIDIHNYPVPRLIEKYLKKIEIRPGIFS